MGRQSNSKKAEVEVGGAVGRRRRFQRPIAINCGGGEKMMSQNNDEE